MNPKRSIKKIICAVLITAMLVSLCSCSGDDKPLTLCSGGESDYTVIYDSDISETVSEAVSSFLAQFKAHCGVLLSKRDDTGQVGSKEIVIGNASRTEINEFSENLKYDEYIITKKKSKLLIVGGSDDATAEAVTYFIQNILPVENAEEFVFTSDDVYRHTCEYPVKNAEISDNIVSEYRIVYPASYGTYVENSNVMKYAAEIVRNFFYRNCGYYLKVVNDSEAKSKYEILVGNTNRAESEELYSDLEMFDYKIEVEGETLSIAPGGLYASGLCIKELEKLISGDALNISDGFTVSGENTAAGEAEPDFVYAGNEAKETAVKSLTVGGVDISKFSIIYPVIKNEESYQIAERYAAEELSDCIFSATGIKLGVKDDSHEKGEYEIVVGSGARSVHDVSSFGEEDFVIRVKDNNLYISGGGYRGTLYGVYEFLEKYLGFRFYTDDCEVIYKAETIEIPKDLLDEQKAEFEFRDSYVNTYYNADISVKRKINSYFSRSFPYKLGGSVEYAGGQHAFVHTMSKFLELSDEDTQPCLSDPATLEKAKARVREMLTLFPETKIISVSQNDNSDACVCGRCMTILYKEGGHSGVLLRFVNSIAEDIAGDFPDVRITTLAYTFTEDPPKLTRPADNVIIQLCTYDMCGSHPYDDALCLRNKNFYERIKGWSEITDNLYIWDYICDFSDDNVPLMNFDNIYYNMQLYRKFGVIGLFYEGDHKHDESYEFSELRAYLISKLMWKPDATPEEYDGWMNEFLQAYYGRGWQLIKTYIEYLTKTGENLHYSYLVSASGAISANDFNAAVSEFDRYFGHIESESDSDRYLGYLESGSNNDATAENIEKLKYGYEYLRETLRR